MTGTDEMARPLDPDHRRFAPQAPTGLLGPDAAPATDSVPPRPGVGPRGWADVGIVAGYLLLAVFVLSGLWAHLDRGYLVNSAQDQNMWEWFFAVTADAVAHLHNPLTSDLQNAPLGVNLMANTAMLGVGIPLAPITLLFGPTVTWTLALTGGLAGTAIAWYWVLSKHLVTSRTAAAIGGGVAGFAPSMISHANAHPNFVAWFLLPFIALRVIALARGARPVRNGIGLGLLVAYQVFLGEEPLLIGAVTLAVFLLAYAASRPREVRPMLRPLGVGIGVGAVLAVLLCAFPLWWQFFGPQSYHSLEHGPMGNDTAALTRFATESVAGAPEAAADVSINRTEENAFFGWPLLVLLVVVTIWLWRDVVARALAVAAFVLTWLSLGSFLTVAHTETDVPGPWLALARLPLFESVLESRFAMGAVPVIGALLALATDRALRTARAVDRRVLPVRLLWLGALVAVLLPIAPTPLSAEVREATPAFFADGTWKSYVDPGGSVVLVPLPNGGNAAGLRWQTEAGLGFRLADGYFVGPNGPNDRRGRYGAQTRPTSTLLDEVVTDGAALAVDETDRDAALADLRYWRADVLVLPPREHQGELRATVEALLRRPATAVDGVLLWDVRDLTR